MEENKMVTWPGMASKPNQGNRIGSVKNSN